MAEFQNESHAGAGSGAGQDARQSRLIAQSSSDIPVGPSPVPPLADNMPLPARIERAGIFGLTVRERAMLGIAATAICTAMVLAAALLWQGNQTAEQAGGATSLTSAPAPIPRGSGSPVALPTPALRAEVEAVRSGKPEVPVTPQRAAPSGSATAAATRPTVTPPSTPTPTPTPAPTPEAAPPPPPPPTSVSVGPPVAMVGATLETRRGTDAAATSAVSERAIKTAAIQSVLDRYRQAFNTLSVEGLSTVWRSVDTKALSRAFAQIEKQTVEFDACQIDITGDVAEASCQGRTSFIPKVGAKSPRVEARRWAFRLVQVRGGWVIDRVESR